MAQEINFNIDIVTWAITRAGFEIHDFLEKFPKVKEWLERKKYPTVKQLEKLSNDLHVPFGYLFLNEPPQESINFPFFRSGKRPSESLSLNVYEVVSTLQKRQDWLVEYLQENEVQKLEYVGKFNSNSNAQQIVNDIRIILDLKEDWASKFSTYNDTLSFISNRIEDIGVIVSFSGIVENNTRRTLSVEECRGFVLVNEIAPFMFINAADAKAAQLFTVIHELAHVWLGVSAGFDNNNMLPADNVMEQLCDKVAAEFLVPEKYFIELWHQRDDIDYISRHFKVSRVVIARRALDLGKISKRDFFELYHKFMASIQFQKEKSSEGGNFYATARKRVSVSFASYINNAVKQNKLLYRDAYKLTGLHGETYHKFMTEHI
jgi:Zn-dependent peptidase ImmA (M78 family)